MLDNNKNTLNSNQKKDFEKSIIKIINIVQTILLKNEQAQEDEYSWPYDD